MMRVILISSVAPSDHSAGHIVLQRHLVDEPEINLQVCNIEPRKGTLREVIRRILGRLSRTGLNAFCQDIMTLWRAGWIDAELPAPEDKDVPTVVMTVAHQEACYAAMRYAKKHDLPLVTFFHDWWPDIPKVHRPFRRILEKSFLGLYDKSSLALCVSSGMKTELGPHPNSRVLLPIPAHVDCQKSDVVAHKDLPFRLLYAGNLNGYGPMLMKALETLKDHSDIRLEVRGNSSSWPESIKKEMTKRGLLLPFVSREELMEWLGSADGFLITQSFDPKQQRLMVTNFPSKLPEFAQFGKPLMIWGPNYSSRPIWARERDQALVIDEEDPQYLVQAMEQLCENTDEQKRLAEAAKAASSTCFDPKGIQSDFMKWLNKIDT